MSQESAIAVITTGLLVVFLTYVVALLLPYVWPQSIAANIRKIATNRRLWHPKTPLDCPQCCCQSRAAPADLVEITPWRTLRSPRGRKKSICSEGVACSNASCVYFGCAVESVHAIVSHGVRGKTDAIRQWHCQACGSVVSERKYTPLYHLKTRPQRICTVMSLLANGVDPSAAARVFGHDDRTVGRWLFRSGQHAKQLHDLFFRRLLCAFLQLDELVANIRGDEERTFVWTAIDARTKIIPQVHVGRRMMTDAYAFVHALIKRLQPGHVPLFSSDGLRHYYSALTAHFGFWCAPGPRKRKPTWHVDTRLVFGMLYKIKAGRKLKELYTRIRCGTRKQWQERATALGFSAKVQTAFVERANLTMRELIAPLARRTWSIARSHTTLDATIHWGLCTYHFIRPHHSLRLSRARERTPAMAARLTEHIWTTQEVLRYKIRYA